MTFWKSKSYSRVMKSHLGYVMKLIVIFNGRCSLLMTFLTQVLTFHDFSQQISGKVTGSILSVDTFLFLIGKFCERQSFEHCRSCWVRWLRSFSLVPRVSVLFCCLNHLALARVSLTCSPGLPLGYFTE